MLRFLAWCSLFLKRWNLPRRRVDMQIGGTNNVLHDHELAVPETRTRSFGHAGVIKLREVHETIKSMCLKSSSRCSTILHVLFGQIRGFSLCLVPQFGPVRRRARKMIVDDLLQTRLDRSGDAGKIRTSIRTRMYSLRNLQRAHKVRCLNVEKEKDRTVALRNQSLWT